MDKTIQNTFNAFFAPYKDGRTLEPSVMVSLIKAQKLPELDEAMHDMMELYMPAIKAERIDAKMWQHLLDESAEINRKYNNKIEIARINLAIIQYLDK